LRGALGELGERGSGRRYAAIDVSLVRRVLNPAPDRVRDDPQLLMQGVVLARQLGVLRDPLSKT
jgi:hypothetical protein